MKLDLDEITVLIGSNNTGKTSILDALQACLSRTLTRRAGVFSDYDYHLPDKSAQPQDAEPIEITLSFLERKEGEWSDTLSQILSDAIVLTDQGTQGLFLRITSRYDATVGDYLTTWSFLDPKGTPLGAKSGNPRYLNELQRLAPVFYLAALRDAAQQFRATSPFWGPFVRSLKMDPEERDEIESALAALNQRVLDSHEAFGPVLERLQKAGQFVPLSGENSVSIEAVPAKVFDMLSRTQVFLSGKTGARLPIGRHGDGTQSLAVICLFEAFLESKLTDGYSLHTDPILALEEPEAHLHPSAVRAVGTLLAGLRGQKIIATHSGDLLASVPITAIRRLSRVSGAIKVHRVAPGTFTEDEIRRLDHYVRLSRGSWLFARFWLLVEGESEVLLLQECARISGHDLFSEGICCVEFPTVGVEKLIRLADQLGIDWLMMADKDKAGSDYVNSATKKLSGRNAADHIRQLPCGAIEAYLCSAGLGDVYKANISTQKAATITATPGSEVYWEQVTKAQSNARSKPELVAEVVSQIEGIGPAAIPTVMQDVIALACNRAEAAG